MARETVARSGQAGAVFKFVVATLVGAFFFLVPVRVGGEWTIPFDVVVGYIREGFPGAVALYCLLAILVSVVLSLVAELQARGSWAPGVSTPATSGPGRRSCCSACWVASSRP